MAEGSAAEAAYQVALREIQRVREEGGTGVTLCHGPFADLARIPPEVAGIEGLKSIQLQGTQVSDLSVLSELTALKEITLSKTKVSDISPLKNLTELQYLDLSGTAVADISPLRNVLNLSTLNLQGTNVSDISALRDHQSLYRLSFKGTKIADISILQGKASFGRLDLDGTLVSDLRPLVAAYAKSMRNFYLLSYRDTPAWAQDAELARIASEANHEHKLTSWAITYLKTLPPWPEPLPWLEATATQRLPAVTTETRPILAAEAQIASLLRNALVTRVTAGQLAGQIEAALVGVPATMGNRLPDVLQSMADVAEVLRALAPDAEPIRETLDEAHLRLRIAQLEAIVERLTSDLADERKRREAAEALAAKDGFLHSYRKSAGTAAGLATVGLVTVGVPAATVYFLGAEHPLVQAVLTVLGRLPKT